MVGIVSYGAYIPYARIDRNMIYQFWGGFPIPGERSVACFDEDSLTMAVEASIDCLKGTDSKTIDGLYFATTTSPYKQNLCSSIMSFIVRYLPGGHQRRQTQQFAFFVLCQEIRTRHALPLRIPFRPQRRHVIQIG